MLTTTSADAVLKSYYLPAVTDQLDKSANPFLARIRQTTSDVWGKDVRKIVRYGVNGGIGAGSETGTLPAANSNSYAQFVSTLKNLYGVIQISDKAMRASANGEGAFVDLLSDEMEGLVKSSSFNLGRMLFGDGSGKLATISGVSGSVYTVDSTRNLAEGMIVDVYSATNTNVAPGRFITSVDHINNKIILSGAPIASPANYTIYMQHSKGLEITGLGAIFSDSETLYGIKRDGNAWLQPLVKTEFGEITEAKLQQTLDEVEQRSGGTVNFIVCSWGVRRAFASALAPYRKLEPMELEGGFRALSYNGIPIVADRFCPAGCMYLLNADDFALHQLGDWQWIEGEDGKILKQIADKAVYTATLVKYAELLCYRPAGQAMLTGVTEA